MVDYQRLICFGKTFEDGQGKDQNMVSKKKMEGFCFHSLMHYDALLGHTVGKQAVESTNTSIAEVQTFCPY